MLNNSIRKDEHRDMLSCNVLCAKNELSIIIIIIIGINTFCPWANIIYHNWYSNLTIDLTHSILEPGGLYVKPIRIR